jgi:hypothetical protein
MKKKFLIVESSQGDEPTMKAIIEQMKQTNIDIRNADTQSIDFEYRNADEDKLSKKLAVTLEIIFTQIRKGLHDRIGIVWDMDNFMEDRDYDTHDRVLFRLGQINGAIKLAIEKMYSSHNIVWDKEIEKMGEFLPIIIDNVKVELGCYFVNYQGKGELEDVLKAIANKPSPIADCVFQNFAECAKTKQGEKPPKNKVLVKLWKEIYVRYDTLPDPNFPEPSKQRSEALTKWENVMAKRSYIFDFDKDEIKELKEFLLLLVKE